MLRALMKKVENMQKQKNNISREIEITTKNQKEILMIKRSGTEKKNAFDGLISRPDMAEERISAFEDVIYQKNPQTPKTKENKD